MHWLPLTGVAAALLLAIGVGAWRAGVFDDAPPAVPTCGELGGSLTAAIGGTWVARGADSPTRPGLPVASCRFGFASGDGRHTGEVTVFVSSGTDARALRDDVDEYPCYGDEEPGQRAGGYLAVRRCVEVIGDTVRAGMSAATRDRFAHALAAIRRSPAAPDDAVEFARDLALRATDRSLTTST